MGERKKWGKGNGDDVLERPHLSKRLTVNGAMTEGVGKNIVDLCFRE